MSFTVIVCIIFFFLGVITPLVAASRKHGCASPTPPTVPGTLIQPPAIHGLLFINEVLSLPNSTWNCSELATHSQANDAWIEIYNSQDQAFDLYTVHTELDTGPGTNAFYFPFGAAIAPHSYLVVFPCTDPLFLLTQASTLRLVISGVAVDQATLPLLGGDMSYARIPDGSNTWQITSTPTIDANNSQVATPTSRLSQLRKGDKNSKSYKGEGNNTATIMDEPNQQKVVHGVQPAWNRVHLPANTPLPSAGATPTSRSTSSPINGNTMDVPRKILLTVLTIASALALLWCKRFFTRS